MRQKKSALEMVISGLMPFVSLAIVVLGDFISFGFNTFNKAFIVRAAIGAVSLLCFFLPFKSIFKERYYNSKRITTKVNEYAEKVTLVYDGNLAAFDDWTRFEYEHRRDNFIKQGLQLSTLTFTEFIDKYKLSPKIINSDKTLSRQQKKIYLSLVNNIRKIKPISSDMVLPGTENNTVFKRLSSSEEKSDKIVTVRKVLRSIVISLGLAMIVFDQSFENAKAISIIVSVGWKLLFGLIHIASAGYTANTLVNKIYFNEISEKSTILAEFLEHAGIKQDNEKQ